LSSVSQRACSRWVCIASAVMTTPARGSGSSSGLKWVISFALPALATLSWPITSPVIWVTAPSRCTLVFPPALASLRSLPSTATAGRAGRWPGSPVMAGSSHGWPGAARTRPSGLVSRSASPAGGLQCRFFFPPPGLPAAARAAIRAATRGSSAVGAAHADSPASSSSASSRAGSRPSVDADGGSYSLVRGLRRHPCPASTSWSQPAAAPAIASGLPCPHATPATSTDTSDGRECRIPRGFRGSASRVPSTSRSDAGSGGAPAAPRWQRTTSISDDAYTGTAFLMIIRT